MEVRYLQPDARTVLKKKNDFKNSFYSLQDLMVMGNNSNKKNLHHITFK